jgi:hypothetical protein
MKSKSRLKFFSILLACYIIGSSGEVIIENGKHELFGVLIVLVASLLSLIILNIKCEACGILLYRYNKKTHGIPNLRCLLPVSKCPVCDVERH